MRHQTTSKRASLIESLLRVPSLELSNSDSWLELPRTSLQPLRARVSPTDAAAARLVLRSRSAALLTSKDCEERYLVLSEDAVLHVLLSIGVLAIHNSSGQGLQLSGMSDQSIRNSKTVVEFLSVLTKNDQQAALMHDDVFAAWERLLLHEKDAVLALVPRAARTSVEALLSTYDARLLRMAHKKLKRGRDKAWSLELAKKRLLLVTILSRFSVVRHSATTAIAGDFRNLAHDAAAIASQAGFPTLVFNIRPGRLRALWSYYTRVLPSRLQGMNVVCYNWPQHRVSLLPRPAVVGCPLEVRTDLSDAELAATSRAMAVAHLWASAQRCSFVATNPSAELLAAAAVCSVAEPLRGFTSPAEPDGL